MLAGLSAAGALLLAPPLHALAAAVEGCSQEPLRLADLAAARGVRFGACVRTDMLPRETGQWAASPYGRMMLEQCDIFTCAYFHWGNYTERTPGGFDFSAAEPLVAFAETNGKQVRGHSLAWYAHTPPWLGESGGRSAAALALQSHIRKVVGTYAGRVQQWDVVNEGLSPKDGLPGGLRRCALTEAIGDDWMAIAFEAARAADPEAVLTYNDYNLESTGYKDSDDKRTALLGLLDRFRRQGTPIDAVGIQSHLFYRAWPSFDETAFAKFLAEVAARGVSISVTELDVIDTGTPTDAGERDRVIADIYARYLAVVLDNPAVTTVVGWGLSDREAWQNSGDSDQFRRRDGTAPRPMPFDADLRAKPAAHAVAGALCAAAVRGSAKEQ